MINRVGGLASGMDIDSIVEKLMTAEKAPLNKLQQQKQTYEWQRDAYRDVNKEVKAFDTLLFDTMTLQRDMLKKTVSSTNPAVSATATTSTTGSLTISKVEQLATNGTAVLQLGERKPQSTKMSSIGLQSDYSLTLKVKQSDGTMKDVTKTIKTTDSIEDVVKKLNDGLGLETFYDEKSGQLAISSKDTGENTDFTDKMKQLFGKIKNTTADVGTITAGQNAKFTVNGATLERTSNSFELNGFNISLEDTYSGAKPITLDAKTDVDNMVDKIKKFVETYNGLVESLNNKVKETKYRDYKPLTEEQKEGMEEDQIKKWEEKAKSGLLRGDSIIREGLASLRGIMYEKGGSTNSKLDTLSELGITTTKSYLDGGKLEINEDKLREAIEKDPEAVMSTFTKSVDKTKGETGEEGIIQKLRSSLSETMRKIEVKAGKTTSTEHNYSIGKYLLNIDDRIDSWKSKLESTEERYWKQFTAMEQAISKANNQSTIFQPSM